MHSTELIDTRRSAILFAVLAAVFIGRGLAAYWLPNLNQSDEISQTLEQAHRLVNGYGIIPWEYRDGVRTWLFPGVLAGMIWLGQQLGDGSGLYLVLVGVLLVSLSLFPMWSALRQPAWSVTDILLLGLVLGAWMDLAYFASKATVEAVCSHLILGTLSLVYPRNAGDLGALRVTGLLLGIAGGIRVHYLPAVAVVALWAWLRLPRAQARSAAPLPDLGPRADRRARLGHLGLSV